MTAPRLDQGRTVDLLNTVWADRAGQYDELADARLASRWLGTDLSASATTRLRELRDALRVLAADRTADPRPVASAPGNRVAEAAEAVATVNAASALAPSWPVLVDGRAETRSQVPRGPAGAGRACRRRDRVPGVRSRAAGLPGAGLRPLLRQGPPAPGVVLDRLRQPGPGRAALRASAYDLVDDDDLDPLELLELRVAGGGHGALEGADQVHGAVGDAGGAEQDLLEGADGLELDPLAAGQ